MTLADAIAALAGHHRIVVVGPHRAGTTISAACLAHDLRLPVLPEEAFGMVDTWRFFKLVESGVTGVIQAPAMTSVCHYLPDPVRVVMVRRPLAEIVRSQQRVAAQAPADWLEVEWARYFRPVGGATPATAKYEAWARYQVPVLGSRAVELEYASLAGHKLWVPPDRRAEFNLRQIAEDR